MKNIGLKRFPNTYKKENMGLISGPLLFIIILFFPFPQVTSSNNANPDSGKNIIIPDETFNIYKSLLNYVY